MPIEFLYGTRESLMGKSETYKRSVRAYLESFGFSQSTDSIIEGTFEDMVFYNPSISPGREFVVEAKAEKVSLRSKELARSLVKYFRLWQAKEPEYRFKFHLFVQAVRIPGEWASLFSETDNVSAAISWCEWYNSSCRSPDEPKIEGRVTEDLVRFFASSLVTVGSSVELETAAAEKESKSAESIHRKAESLLAIANKRKTPAMITSRLIMNILPITIPKEYYVCGSSASSKEEIYEGLKDVLIPPFVWQSDHTMMSFVRFDQGNSLSSYAKGVVSAENTKELQIQNPSLGSQLVNTHLRRIIWDRGIYRDGDSCYFPMLDKSAGKRAELDRSGKERWVVKKMFHTKDTKHARKGDLNFYFHRSVELNTPTYWGISFVELIPRRYYTFDGETPIDGAIRAKIDAKFRKPLLDRSTTRIASMKLWKFLLFESKYQRPPEDWFDTFKFGNFIEEQVDWSPRVIDREQTPLWDFIGSDSDANP